jgi:hypothetical protein
MVPPRTQVPSNSEHHLQRRHSSRAVVVGLFSPLDMRLGGRSILDTLVVTLLPPHLIEVHST